MAFSYAARSCAGVRLSLSLVALFITADAPPSWLAKPERHRPRHDEIVVLPLAGFMGEVTTGDRIVETLQLAYHVLSPWRPAHSW